jgi:hypothetical protein
LRLITSSNLVGCTTERSAGLLAAEFIRLREVRRAQAR